MLPGNEILKIISDCFPKYESLTALSNKTNVDRGLWKRFKLGEDKVPARKKRLQDIESTFGIPVDIWALVSNEEIRREVFRILISEENRHWGRKNPLVPAFDSAQQSNSKLFHERVQLESEIACLFNDSTFKIANIYGRPESGKSALLANWWWSIGFKNYLHTFIALDCADFSEGDSIVEAIYSYFSDNQVGLDSKIRWLSTNRRNLECTIVLDGLQSFLDPTSSIFISKSLEKVLLALSLPGSSLRLVLVTENKVLWKSEEFLENPAVFVDDFSRKEALAFLDRRIPAIGRLEINRHPFLLI